MPSFIDDPELATFIETIDSLVADVFNEKASPQLITYSQLMLFRAIWPTLAFEDNQVLRKRRVISNFANDLENAFPEFVNVEALELLKGELNDRQKDLSTPELV